MIDVAQAFGAAPYVNIDHMPRAFAANKIPDTATDDAPDACSATWTNHVSNVRPSDPALFAQGVAGLVRRVVEGSGGEPGRPVRYWEFWNEPDLSYGWSPSVGDTCRCR